MHCINWMIFFKVFKWDHHLFVTQVSLMKCDSWKLVSLCDIKHRHRVAFLHQTLNQVPPQKARAANDSTSFTALFTGNSELLLNTIDTVAWRLYWTFYLLIDFISGQNWDFAVWIQHIHLGLKSCCLTAPGFQVPGSRFLSLGLNLLCALCFILTS